jgi:regulator of CtrA degradation
MVNEPVSITPRDFAASDMFARTFAEGMGLVEETAAYLEGPGRAASRDLAREAALEYASESMRLTTKLMQVASWLLVHRAVREGEMTDDEARAERYRLSEVESSGSATPLAVRGQIPQALKELRERADKLFERVRRLDARLHGDGAPAAPTNPVGSQLQALEQAFKNTRR